MGCTYSPTSELALHQSTVLEVRGLRLKPHWVYVYVCSHFLERYACNQEEATNKLIGGRINQGLVARDGGWLVRAWDS